jgi:hypothetical protein
MIMIRSLRVQMTNMLYSLQMYLTNVPNQHTNATNYLLKFIYGLRNGQASPRLSCPCFPIGDVLKQLFCPRCGCCTYSATSIFKKVTFFARVNNKTAKIYSYRTIPTL